MTPTNGVNAWRHLVLVGATLVVSLSVLATVGGLAACVVGSLLILDLVSRRSQHLLANAALVALLLLPAIWFIGATGPLYPPAPRIQANTLAHQIGGAAVWLMALAVVVETVRTEGWLLHGRTRPGKRAGHGRSGTRTGRRAGPETQRESRRRQDVTPGRDQGEEGRRHEL